MWLSLQNLVSFNSLAFFQIQTTCCSIYFSCIYWYSKLLNILSFLSFCNYSSNRTWTSLTFSSLKGEIVSLSIKLCFYVMYARSCAHTYINMRTFIYFFRSMYNLLSRFMLDRRMRISSYELQQCQWHLVKLRDAFHVWFV